LRIVQREGSAEGGVFEGLWLAHAERARLVKVWGAAASAATAAVLLNTKRPTLEKFRVVAASETASRPILADFRDEAPPSGPVRWVHPTNLN
jgi:hypothetical protein